MRKFAQFKLSFIFVTTSKMVPCHFFVLFSIIKASEIIGGFSVFVNKIQKNLCK